MRAFLAIMATLLPLSLVGATPALAGREAAILPAAPASTPIVAIHYPVTPRLDLTEDHFGVSVADPYRWLESDPRTDPAVADWVARENALTHATIDAMPGRDILKARLRALLSHGRTTMPRKAGGRIFYGRNSGLQNQTPLYMRLGYDGPEKLLVDPNIWSADGALALAEWMPSPDGRHLAYAMQEAGSDWRTLRVLEVDSGRLLDDRIEHVKFSQIAWSRDGSGFFYSGFPAPSDSQSASENQAVRYHRLGADAVADAIVYATPDRPTLSHSAQVTNDGGWLVVSSFAGITPGRELHIAALDGRSLKLRSLVRGLANDWRFVGSRGSALYFVTDYKAPRLRVVALDAARPRRDPIEVVPQRAETLAGGSLVGNRMVLAYLNDGQTVAELVELDGRKAGDVPMPGVGMAAGFAQPGEGSETFYSFSSFTTPPTIYRFDSATRVSTLFARPELPFDPEQFGVEQTSYASKDGTMVPITIIRKKSLAASNSPAPTILYGYGGFNISLTPGYSPTRMAWLEQGGVYAIANLRGGGEYGRAWHDAGRLANKQTSFDDFIAAAEWLKAKGYAKADGLAIEGRSNGGLLVGAVVNQRPDLFAAALPAVGVMDMLRFDRFTAGRYWTEDYGSPSVEADFRALYAYSPYHNIAARADYPAILVTTGDSDDRVVPAHSFKYAAALQAADLGARPRLIRIEGRSGHGAGKPIDKLIDEVADSYAFAAHYTGLAIATPNP
jgi:prolyl oligopeptidase